MSDHRLAKIQAMDDIDLLTFVTQTRDEAIRAEEYKAFVEMAAALRAGDRNVLSKRQRSWAEEAALRIMPFDASLVPTGRVVVTPSVLLNLPKKPPGRK